MAKRHVLALAAILCAAVLLEGCRKQENSAPTYPGAPENGAAPTTNAASPAGDSRALPLPQNLMIDPLSIRVIQGAQLVFFRGRVVNEQNQASQSVMWVVHSSAGKLMQVMDMVPGELRTQNSAVLMVEPSPDGRWVAMTLMREANDVVTLLVDFFAAGGPKWAAVERAAATGKPVWAGGQALLASYDDKGIMPMRIVSPAGQVRQTELRVEPLAASADGSVLLVVSEPTDLRKGFALQDRPRAHVVAISGADGTPLKDFGPLAMFGETPVVSENGGYIAFQANPPQREQPAGVMGMPVLQGGVENRLQMKVLAVRQGTDRVHPTSAVPLYVSENGDVLSVSVLGPSSWVRYFPAEGESPVLRWSVSAASVVQGRLVVATAGQQPLLLITPPLINRNGLAVPVATTTPATTQATQP